MTTVQPDWETGTLYVGGLSFLLIIIVWLGFCLLFIRASDWSTRLVGWTLLIAPLLHYWMEGGL